MHEEKLFYKFLAEAQKNSHGQKTMKRVKYSGQKVLEEFRNKPVDETTGQAIYEAGFQDALYFAQAEIALWAVTPSPKRSIGELIEKIGGIPDQEVPDGS